MKRQSQKEGVLIVGAGPIGLACAISARRRGLDPLVIDAGAIVDSIARYPVQMTFFTTPELLEIGGHPLTCSGQKPTREEALMYYRGVVRAEGLRVATFTRLTACEPAPGGFNVALCGPRESRNLLAERVVLATGYFDNPKMLGVPGEELSHVSHYFDEAHQSYGRDVVVIGGKNSAVEAALSLYRAGARTTIVYRRSEFPSSVKYWLKPDIENRIRSGEIAACMNCRVVSIDETHVTVKTGDEGTKSLPADRVYALTGFLPDTDLFRRLGIEIDGSSGRPCLDPRTLETNVPGLYMAGSITAGWKTSEIFIENGRFDGEKIFG